MLRRGVGGGRRLRGGARRRRLGRQRRHERRERRRRERRPAPAALRGHRAIANTARHRPARPVAARIGTHIRHAAPDWLPTACAPPQRAAPLAAAIVIAPVALPRCRVLPRAILLGDTSRAVLLGAAVLVRRGVGGAPSRATSEVGVVEARVAPLVTAPVFNRGVLLPCRRARSPRVGTPPAALHRGAWVGQTQRHRRLRRRLARAPEAVAGWPVAGPLPLGVPSQSDRQARPGGRRRSRAGAPPRGARGAL